MQELPYILVVLGIMIVIISLFVPDKEKKKQKEKQESMTSEERAGLIAQGKKEIDEIFNDRAEDTLEKVDEQLSRLSNEKIMSVSEYSDQVLEKINQNHQEVVFLYHMLNEKEEEMKKMMSKVKNVSKEDTKGMQQEERLLNQVKKIEMVSDKTLPENEKETVPVSAEDEKFQDNADIEMLRGLLYEEKTPEGKPYNVSASEYMHPGSGDISYTEENGIQAQVLEMYRDGMSILEISKALHKGQGEVRLIVELYARK